MADSATVTTNVSNGSTISSTLTDGVSITTSVNEGTSVSATVTTGGVGATGETGEGVPTGGTTGQVLAKASNTNYDTEWVEPTEGGEGAVSSVNSQTGAVVLDTDDISEGTNKYVTAAEKTKLSNLSGTNTGDQNLSTYTVGAASSTDNAIARFDSTTGKVIQNSGITVADNNYMYTPASIESEGAIIADTISEHTAAAGVTIDGVLLKDGAIAKSVVGLGNVDNTSNATERAATATLTNKTLTAPVINAPTGFLTGAAKITVGTSTPGSPTTGDLWIDTN